MPLYLFDTTDTFGRRVYMTFARWDGHVLSRHPWMSEFEHLVHRVIENPTYINYDVDYDKREVYYAEGLIPETGETLKQWWSSWIKTKAK